jgi:ribosomal protein S20
MTKNENTLIKQFIGKIANKDFSNANSLLEKVVSEKIKTQVRNVVQKNKAEQNK